VKDGLLAVPICTTYRALSPAWGSELEDESTKELPVPSATWC